MAALRTTQTSTCSYCGVGCGVQIHSYTNGNVEVEGDPSHPASKGMLCSKGMNLHYAAMDTSDRILHPMMRAHRDLPLQQVSWEAAIQRAAGVFSSIIKKYGPDSVGFYVSGQCLTEEYYLVNKITKGFLGTNNIDTNSRLCMSSAVVGYKSTLGEDSVPVSYDDIELADCFFITGANPAWCHPILFRRIEAHKAANPNVTIIVADPRKTQTCAIADIHLPIQPGTDIYLYHALSRVLIEENYIDTEFINQYTDGFEALRSQVMSTSLEDYALQCDVPLQDIQLAARAIGKAKGYISMWAMGLNQSVIGVKKNVALINLSLITGKIGKPGNGPFSLTGQPNAMGGREVGGLANLLPAHLNLANAEHRKYVADFWGVPTIQEKPGFTATEMFQHLASGKMKAIWIICTNPLVSLPDATQIEAALDKAAFVVVQDISNRSDTLAYADLVLPAAAYMEKEGVMTNSDRRISYLNKVLEAPGQALPDIEILTRFAHAMGWKESFNYTCAADIFNEYTQITRNTNIDISGLSYDDLKKRRSVQWPVPTPGHPGTPRLFTDFKFYTPNTKAQIGTASPENQSAPTTPDFPLILTTGRIRDQWHTMTRTGKVRKLTSHIAKPYLEIHPEDAAVRGLKQDAIAEIYNSLGSVRVPVKITEDIRKGCVFLPMHWGKIMQSTQARANNITHTVVDPISKEPDFKYNAVEVKVYTKPKEHIIIIGAGAAACQFIRRHKALAPDDVLTVFSGEVNPFYNRVLLPEYLSGHKMWKHLQKLEEPEWNALGVNVIRQRIEHINKESKIITDASGIRYSYDRLIVATGSRAFRLKSLPALEGIYTIRQKEDTDKLLHRIKKGDNVVVVGGGLLGLEMADALVEIGMKVTVIQRSNRLMDRQLDKTSADLLAEELQDRGMDLYFNDEVLYINGEKEVESIRLRSSRKIDCKAVLFAIGTQPNIELLKDAGVTTNRGVVVNEYLQTSDVSIYAMGEIAECNGQLFGITAAAEEQANVLSAHLTGDPTAFYKGSLSMNILKVHGVELCSIGMIEIPSDEEGYEEVVFMDKHRRYYKKCIVYKDRLVGAILMGDKSEFNEFRNLIHSQTELGDKRAHLLTSGNSTKEPLMGKLVCSCNGVGEGNIEKAVHSGCADFVQLCSTTGAGTGCGSCKPEVKAILDRCSIKQMKEVERVH